MDFRHVLNIILSVFVTVSTSFSNDDSLFLDTDLSDEGSAAFNSLDLSSVFSSAPSDAFDSKFGEWDKSDFFFK